MLFDKYTLPTLLCFSFVVHALHGNTSCPYSENFEMNQNLQADQKESANESESPEKKEEEKPKSPHTFTGNISLVSDYRFRGISQTMRRPAIQG